MCLWEWIAYGAPAMHKYIFLFLPVRQSHFIVTPHDHEQSVLTNKNLFHRSRNLKRPANIKFQYAIAISRSERENSNIKKHSSELHNKLKSNKCQY